MDKKNLGIGEYYATRKPSVIYTLLGSCVATCLYDPEHRLGGMNHILFPSAPSMATYNRPARFGINAMELLINMIFRLGGEKKNLKAKIFGGANVLPMITGDLVAGPRNVAFVKEFLALESIPVVAENTGGVYTRIIYFHTDSGNVYLRRSRGASMINRGLEEEKLKQTIKMKMNKTVKPKMF